MKPLTIVSLVAVVAVSSAPAAFGWGFHGGGFSGGSYHGAYGGSFAHSDGSWSATGARGRSGVERHSRQWRDQTAHAAQGTDAAPRISFFSYCSVTTILGTHQDRLSADRSAQF
jgi:hypothetical protein